MAKFYISTAIHYVNDDPHIGHMYENIVADVIARHRRRMGDDVRFLTGTDEHGQKIERAAAREGITPIELADRVVNTHHELRKKLNLSNDDFIRTTEARHRIAVLEVIRRIQERNPTDIYLGEHSGWYCQSEETFIPENQVKDGVDQDGHKVEWTTERNYFFKLSNYTHRLLEHYRDHPEFVWPPSRLNEVRKFVEQGLNDLSISRSSIKWGIPFPGDPDHVIYVWMDALTNYISALGFGSADQTLFDRYWPAEIHLIGKDIVRFHAVYWPAFLMAAGIELPKRVVGHGFWLRDQQKISKSLGNVVRPYNILEDFGADALRYYVTREMVFGQDQDYSDQSLITRYNADLANDLGNTLSRAVKMSASYFADKTSSSCCSRAVTRGRRAPTFAPRFAWPETCEESMSKTQTSKHDVAEHLRTTDEMVAYFEACLEEAPDDAAFIAKALGDIARAKGMSQVARDSGLSRESLYKALSGERSPDFATILRVMSALGLRLHAKADA